MNNSIFPLPFSMHLIFVIIAFVLFLIQYIRLKRPYQIIVAAAVAASMLIYANTSKLWINIVGVIEAVLLITALVSSVIGSKRAKKQSDKNENDKTQAESGGEMAQ